MQNVNLLDRRLLPAQPRVPSGLALIIFGLAALGVSAHALLERQLTQRALAALAAPASAATAESADTSAAGTANGTGTAAQQLARLRAELASRKALLAALSRELAGPADSAQTLRQVIAALPATMWLTEVELSGSKDLRISGGTLDPLALAEFARRLATTAGLQGIGLQTVRLEPATEAASSETSPQPPMHRFVLASMATSAAEGR